MEPKFPIDTQLEAFRLPKFCKDCKHFYVNTKCVIKAIPHCRAPHIQLDLVTGEPVPLWCQTARQESNLCGEDARWFEAK